MTILYSASFLVLTAANLALAFVQWRAADFKWITRHIKDDQESKPRAPPLDSPKADLKDTEAVRKFQLAFFSVYACVVASDWLQVNGHRKVMDKNISSSCANRR